ncbi:MAG: DegV family protein [Chloroflexota bacterium]
MNIRLVVDSTLDVPTEIVEQYNMIVLPAFVNYGGNSYADNGVELDRESFYGVLGSLEQVPTTSAPSPGITQDTMMEALEGADHVIMCSLSAKLSGVNNVMTLAAQDISSERITVYDTNSLSLGGGFQAIAGAKAAAAGGSVNDVLNTMQDVYRRQTVYCGLMNIDFVRKGGRLSWAAGAIGSLLKIRPVVIVEDGYINSVASVRKRGAWIDKLEQLARKRAPIESLAFIHTENMEDLTELRERIADIVPENSFTTYATPSIGVHTGPQAVAFALVSR